MSPGRRLKVAPLRRRFAAGLIDLFAFGLPFFAAMLGFSWAYVTYRQRRGLENGDLRAPQLGHGSRFVVWVVGCAMQVQARNRRGLGYRVFGLRRVDARTGGPVSIRSTLIRVTVSTASRGLTRLLVRRSRERGEVDEQKVLSARGSCLPALVPVMLLQLPAVWSPLNQALPDRLAGTVVVEE